MANYFAGAPAYQGYSTAFAPTASYTSGYPATTSFAGYSNYPAVSSYSGVFPTAEYNTGYSAAAGLPFSSYSGAGFATTSTGYGLPSSYYNNAYTTAPSAFPEFASYSTASPFAAYGAQYVPQQQSVFGGLTASLPYSGLTSTYAAPSSYALAPFTGFSGFPATSFPATSFPTASFPGFSSFSGLPASFAAGFPAAPLAVVEATLAGEIPPLSSETVTQVETVVPVVAEETVVAEEATEEQIEAGASAAF